MWRCALVLNILTLAAAVKGQGTSDLGRVALSVVMPDNIEQLDASQVSKLETKITQIVTGAGLAASGYDQNFVIYPKLAIYEDQVVEGGMQAIHVVKAELGLIIQQVENGIVYSAITYPLTGSGSTLAAGVTNAISKIPVQDPGLRGFVEKGKQKIIDYYALKCGDIVSRSESLVRMDQYAEAIWLLFTVPEELSECYKRVQEKAVAAYIAYQSQQCQEMMQEARARYAATQYLEALDILAEVDPSSSCQSEARSLMASARARITEAQRQAHAFKMKKYEDNLALTHARLAAAKEVALAYYKSRPTKVTYNLLIVR